MSSNVSRITQLTRRGAGPFDPQSQPLRLLGGASGEEDPAAATSDVFLRASPADAWPAGRPSVTSRSKFLDTDLFSQRQANASNFPHL